jgi:hypothetical protein
MNRIIDENLLGRNALAIVIVQRLLPDATQNEKKDLREIISLIEEGTRELDTPHRG